MFRLIFAAFIVLTGGLASAAPLRIEITQGVIEPMPFAVPIFIAAVSYTHLTLPTNREV